MSLQSQLLMLQHADSFFPSGASSWSWGLEPLAHDFKHQFNTRTRQRHTQQELPQTDNAKWVEQFVLSQLQHRFYHFDAYFLQQAWQSADDLTSLMQLDEEVDSFTLVHEARQGSMKMGNSLLRLYAQHDLAKDWLEQIQQKQAYGHSCVVQGAMFATLGFELNDAVLTVAHGYVTSLVSAAIRLGLIGYLESQQILGTAHQLLAALIQKGLPSCAALSTFNPMVEIAMMRHEHQETRLFSN